MRFYLFIVMLFAFPAAAQTTDDAESAPSQAPIGMSDLVIRGLLKDMIVIEVRGKQRTVFAGKSSPEGFKLISSSVKGAVVEFDGERHELGISRQVGSSRAFTEPVIREVRVGQGRGGHYFTPGRINNRPVDFLVDTGATSVVMNAIEAGKLQINYKKGTPVNMQTASGVSKGYRLTLRSVSVGNVKVTNVDAVITDGAFPAEILLGNSYLSRVEMKVDQGVLVLQARF